MLMDVKRCYRSHNTFAFQTYNVDHQVADSAATATAYLCGIKANYGTIGVNAYVKRGKCHAVKGNNVTCIAELAQNAGTLPCIIAQSMVQMVKNVRNQLFFLCTQ